MLPIFTVSAAVGAFSCSSVRRRRAVRLVRPALPSFQLNLSALALIVPGRRSRSLPGARVHWPGSRPASASHWCCSRPGWCTRRGSVRRPREQALLRGARRQRILRRISDDSIEAIPPADGSPISGSLQLGLSGRVEQAAWLIFMSDAGAAWTLGRIASFLADSAARGRDRDVRDTGPFPRHEARRRLAAARARRRRRAARAPCSCGSAASGSTYVTSATRPRVPALPDRQLPGHVRRSRRFSRGL